MIGNFVVSREGAATQIRFPQAGKARQKPVPVETRLIHPAEPFSHRDDLEGDPPSLEKKVSIKKEIFLLATVAKTVSELTGADGKVCPLLNAESHQHQSEEKR